MSKLRLNEINFNDDEVIVEVDKEEKKVELKNHKVAFEILVEELLKNDIVESLDEVEGIVQRYQRQQKGEYLPIFHAEYRKEKRRNQDRSHGAPAEKRV